MAIHRFFARTLLPTTALLVFASACGNKKAEDAAADAAVPGSALGGGILANEAPVAGESPLAAAYREACDKVVECATDAEREQVGRDMLCVGVGMENGRARMQGGACETAVTAHLRCLSQQSCDALKGASSACEQEREASSAACE